MIVVRGRTLAGMAAAARLARLGHDVTLTGEPRAHPLLLDFFELPAAWRDLFKKTGRPLPGELLHLGATLVAAPPTTYLLPDGAELRLPDERGAQFYAVQEAFGTLEARRWRDLLDALDDVWAAMRRSGIEAVEDVGTKEDRRALWLERTVADVADRAGRLAPIVLAQGYLEGTDSHRAPGVVAARLAIQRAFGRHRLVASDGRPLSATALIELLERRLERRGVRFSPATASGEHEIDCIPRLPPGRLVRPRPALVPHAAEDEPGEPAEVVDLTGSAPVRTLRTPERAVTLDYRALAPDLSAGLAPDDARRWLLRPIPAHQTASSASRAGGAAWAELMSAALAVYQLHELLTGEDPRPTNKAFKLPRIHGGR